ncbi:TetR/AcrR family transcriptional regulator [Nocardia bovistercoris]|uniref:TetR/AcrR family transcriptional regulator n=1 Tax=Nocardia bovistercoris TaxID=2785916 RepID=A0A931IEE7_9NOCA|nr:TetR/AcrR family transcriptional regulator [Nocardia bovistercoris]MBH0779909.1 TetR/AcrR family transcriptional regulator [Nocardia bovistercoris]
MPSLTRVTVSRRSHSDERRNEFEEQVLQALEGLMADGTPYTELAVQRIASASKVARSTFYRHFPDKSQLLIRMADLATKDLFDAAENWWRADHADADRSVVEAMRAMISGFRRHRLLLMALTEVSAYDRDVGRYWHARVQAFMQIVCERLAAEQHAGRIDADLDIVPTAIVLTAMVERSITAVFGADSPIDDEQLAKALGRAILLVTYGRN